MSGPGQQPVDYDALAQQHGAVVDYDALASQHGGNEGGAPEAPPQASGVERFGKGVLSGLGVVSNEQGKNFFRHPIDTLTQMAQGQGELAVRAKNELANKDYVRGLTHAVEYLMPGLGPTLAHAGDQLQSGDVAGGVGTTLGAAIPIAASSPSAQGLKAKLPIGKLPERMYQSALKPSTTLSTNEVGGMVKTGLENKIPVSAEGAAKLDNLVSELSDKVKSQIQSGSKSGATVDPAAIAGRADQAKAKFATQVTPDSDIAAIEGAKQEFLRNNPNAIPAADAQAMKQGTYQQLKSKYGELNSATVEAQKALARGIKEELETQFPEIKGINAQQAKLINLDSALERAVRRIDNRDLFSLGGKLAGATGAAVGGAGGGLVGFVMHHVITSPEIQSKLAIALSQAGKGGIPLSSSMARVAAYGAALGQSAAASQPSDSQPRQ